MHVHHHSCQTRWTTYLCRYSVSNKRHTWSKEAHRRYLQPSVGHVALQSVPCTTHCYELDSGGSPHISDIYSGGSGTARFTLFYFEMVSLSIYIFLVSTTRTGSTLAEEVVVPWHPNPNQCLVHCPMWWILLAVMNGHHIQVLTGSHWTIALWEIFLASHSH